MPSILIFLSRSNFFLSNVTYPAQVWRKNDKSVGKLVASNKKITKIVVDPNEETADIDTSNNSWPATKNVSEFDKFKNQNKQ